MPRVPTPAHDDSAAANGITAAQALARWILSIDGAHVRADAVHQAKLLLLDSIGCAFAGRDEPVCRAVLAVCTGPGRSGPCTIIGTRQKTDAARAVLANGVLARVLDLNDYVVGGSKGVPEIGGHPSDNIPVALAIGECRGRHGRDVLAAIVVGYEIYGRLKTMMDRRGAWDGVTVSGVVAPAIAGRLMKLDEGRLAHALALGGTRAATPAIVRRGGISAAKSIANALVAESGVAASLLAEQGVTGPLAVLEDDLGLRAIFPNGDIGAILTAALPDESYIMRSNVKAYPCLATGQGAVAAAIGLHAKLGGAVETIARIEVTMADYLFLQHQQHDPGRVRPASREAADHSFQFLVAAALTDGAFGPAQFEHRRWSDPAIVALMERIVMRTDPAWNARAPGSYPCAIRVVAIDGREHSVEVPYPPGYSRGGIAAADVVDKFHAVTAAALDRDRRERIVAAVLDFDRAETTDRLTATLGA